MKRTKSETKKPYKTRKRQAVTKTVNKTTIAKIRANASDSPLVSLPAELREKVLKLLVGDRWIHIDMKPRQNFGFEVDQVRHALCIASPTTKPVPLNPHPANINGAFVIKADLREDRHGLCKQYWSNSPEERRIQASDRQLELSILGACRQLYEEGNQYLWATNVFAFDYHRAFHTFISMLNSAQKRNMRKLSIEGSTLWHSYTIVRSLEEWRLTLVTSPMVSSLRGVKTLHLSLNHDLWRLTDRHDENFELERCLTDLRLALRGLGGLRSLQLDVASVTVTTKPIGSLSSEYQATLTTRCREVASDFHAQLIDPLGASIAKVDNAKLRVEECQLLLDRARSELNYCRQRLADIREQADRGIKVTNKHGQIVRLEAKEEDLVTKFERLENKIQWGKEEVKELEANYVAEQQGCQKGEKM